MLLNLKKIAQRGGDRGPLYDCGVLAVVEEIEKTGGFTKSPICRLLLLVKLEHDVKCGIATADELGQASKFLTDHGWTLDQGFEYARGVDGAERLLFYFANP